MKSQIKTLLALGFLLLWGCVPTEPTQTKNDVGPMLIPNPTLVNLLKVTSQIYSGAEPQGEPAFAALAKLGIKTIVSVDGARPNLEAAQKYNLRYVHIPIGYDGIGLKARLAFARLAREVQGPFYIHCHHGRHRGPAAAAIISLAGEGGDHDDAIQILKIAGTSPNYAGLWRAVREYEKPAPNVPLPKLVEVAEVGSLALAMAKIDRVYDQLQYCRDADWGTPLEHPDLIPHQQALLLKEGFRESGRHLGDEYDPPFKAWLTDAERQSQKLEEALVRGDAQAAARSFKAVVQSCTQCHRQYR